MREAGPRIPTGSIDPWFGTHIASLKLPLDEARILELQRLLSDLIVGVERPTAIGTKRESAPSLHLRDEPVLKELMHVVLRSCEQYVNYVSGEPDWRSLYEAEQLALTASYAGSARAVEGIRPPTLQISSAWANAYSSGDGHDWHFHPNSLLSVVVALNGEEGDEFPELEFEDPRFWAQLYHPGLYLGRVGRAVGVGPDPAIVIFPSYLRHRVPVKSRQLTRYSVSINVTLGQS